MSESITKQKIPMSFNLDDFYTTQEQRDDEKKEKIDEVSVSLIDNFKNHPFKVLDNDEMKTLENSIQNNGLMEAVIIRPKKDGRFEMISGHRRLMACKNLGLETIPCRIRDLTDDEATIYMVDSNLHREKLLPSEKAFAYKMKYEALQHQRKTTATQVNTEVRPLGTVVRSDNILADELGESARQIQRYIRLTNLIPKLLTMVDNAELKEMPAIALRPAVELSFLTKEEQKMLAEYIEYNFVWRRKLFNDIIRLCVRKVHIRCVTLILGRIIETDCQCQPGIPGSEHIPRDLIAHISRFFRFVRLAPIAPFAALRRRRPSLR